MIGEGCPLPGDALTRVDALDRRLAAIERWVGLRPDLNDLDQEIARVRQAKEAAIDRQDFEVSAALRDQERQLLAARAGREKEWTEAAAGRMPLAQELGRVKAELERLRAVLREHGIAPGTTLHRRAHTMSIRSRATRKAAARCTDSAWGRAALMCAALWLMARRAPGRTAQRQSPALTPGQRHRAAAPP